MNFQVNLNSYFVQALNTQAYVFSRSDSLEFKSSEETSPSFLRAPLVRRLHSRRSKLDFVGKINWFLLLLFILLLFFVVLLTIFFVGTPHAGNDDGKMSDRLITSLPHANNAFPSV